MQTPTSGLQEKAGPLLIHASNSNKLPHRLFLARHFDLTTQRLVLPTKSSANLGNTSQIMVPRSY